MTTATTVNKDQFKDLIGPTDYKVDSQARERLITARIGLLLKKPFFGNLATRLKLTNADEWCPTAATDGRKFYYNSRFIMLLADEKECEFLFGHEVLHCIYEHIGRRVDNKHQGQLSNIAADYCVNGDLVKHNVGRMITTVPCLHDTKYYGWSYEKVYKDLYDNAEKIDISEEQVRLKNHCDYFRSILADAEAAKGKKLSFILQEFGREINTTGSKANDVLIQQAVILMKDELEKAKEQVLNIL